MNFRTEEPRMKYRPRAKDMTPRRLRVLLELRRLWVENSYAPSVRELMDAMELRSPSSVHAHLESLERQGLTARFHRRARGWRLTRAGQRVSHDLQGAA